MNNTEELLNTIDNAFTGLMSKVEAVEKTAYNKVLESIAGLEYKNGRLLPNAKNMRVMAEMKGGLTNVLRSPQYVEAVTKFGKQYDVVAKVQNNYFEAIVKDFKPSGAVEITKKMSINTMVDNLVGGGVNQEVTQKAANILLQNIQGGSTVMKLTEDLRNFMLTTPSGLGSLNRYASQIANDSINQYAAAYNEQITEDLGFEWFQYVGSLRDTSRDFCVALVSQRYIHKSEFAKAAKGILRNKTVSTAGMYKTTDANTLKVLRGGYTCKHQFRGVATGTVPQSVRDAVTGAKAEEPTSGFAEAKTIKEAKEQFKNIIETNTGFVVEKTTFSRDLTIERVNARNKQVSALFNEYEIDKSYIKNTNVKIAYQSNSREYGAIYYLQNRNQITTINLGSQNSLSRVEDVIFPKENGNFYFMFRKSLVDSKNLDIATTTHEFAHLISLNRHGLDERIAEFTPKLRTIRQNYIDEISEIKGAELLNNLTPPTAKKLKSIYLGDYASTNLNEFMAEAFTEYKLKANPSKYAVEVGNLIDKYFKRK